MNLLNIYDKGGIVMEVRISFDPYTEENIIVGTDTHITSQAFIHRVHEAIKDLLKEPSVQQIIQEDGGLHLVWDTDSCCFMPLDR